MIILWWYDVLNERVDRGLNGVTDRRQLRRTRKGGRPRYGHTLDPYL